MAWLILGVGLLTTVFTCIQVKQNIEQDAVKQFAFTCDQITLKLQEHLEAYALVLKGGSAFFTGSDVVKRQEWKAYVDSLQVEQSIPGMQGIGFAKVIPAAQLTSHITTVRGEGFPDYSVHPPGERAFYTSIIYLEPFTGRNLRAFGFDMYNEPVRRLAMEKARDTGDTALSGKVELIQETGTDVQAGVLMYVPVYRTGAPAATVEQKQAALQGWVYSPYRMNDFMRSILTDWKRHDGKIVNLAIYDNQEASPANRLFANLPTVTPDVHSLFYQQRIINFKGRQWLLVFDHTKTPFAISYGQVLTILICGFALSGLLFGLMRSITKTQTNAVGIANKLTEKIQLLLDSTAEAIYGIDLNGDCTFCNDACLKMLGYTHYDELLGKNMHWLIHGKHKNGTAFPIEDCPIFQAFKKGERIHIDNEVLWRIDGSCFAAEYWSYPRSHEGVIIGAVVTFMDITERKQMEMALRDSEFRWKFAIEGSGDGVWDWNIQSHETVYSPLWKAMLGYTEADILPTVQEWQTRIHPDDQLPVQELLQAYLSGKTEHYMVEFRLRCKDNSYKWILARGMLVSKSEDNKPLRMIGTHTDISELKNKEVALEEALSRLQKITRRLPGIAYQFRLRPDGSTSFPYISQVIKDTYGISPEELHDDASKMFDLIHPDDLDDVIAAIQKSAQKLIPWSHEYRVQYNDSVHWLYGNSLPEQEADGSILWYGFISDITERKQDEVLLIKTNTQLQTEIQERKVIEKALRESENRFRVIADHAPVLIWIAGLDKGCYFFNKVWLEFSGRSLQEEEGNGWAEGVHPEDFQFCLNIYVTAFDARQTFTMEYRLRRFDGEHRWLLDNGVPYYDDNNTFLGFIGSCIDITERKNQDTILLKNNVDLENARVSAEKANQAKSEFLSSMSHELRSPLNAILGFAQLMELDSPPPTPSQAESIVQIIEAGWHLLKLINEILDLAKIESGQTSLYQESLSLNEIIEECCTMMKPKSRKYGIPIIIPPADAQYVVYADRVRLKQVLINLLSNAVKYNRKQGTVEVQCTENTLGYLRVSILDTGDGLSPDQLAQLFQRFNRLGQESGNREGTGIGLIVAKQLIELMGGIIGVDSHVGTGSVFWIELPAMTGSHPDLVDSIAIALPAPREALEAPQQTLLYVEDNPANMKLVEKIIARQPNLRLLTANDATSGIQIARDYQPIIILMDINLPGINGIEALHLLRSDPSTAHITVLALSANAMPADVEKGLESGFFNYITKPININEFMAKLDTALAFANEINHDRQSGV